MSEAPELVLDPIGDEIFDLMRRQPGDVFSSAALAAQLGYSENDINASLPRLVQLGLVERRETGETPGYILSAGAPEL